MRFYFTLQPKPVLITRQRLLDHGNQNLFISPRCNPSRTLRRFRHGGGDATARRHMYHTSRSSCKIRRRTQQVQTTTTSLKSPIVRLDGPNSLFLQTRSLLSRPQNICHFDWTLTRRSLTSEAIIDADTRRRVRP